LFEKMITTILIASLVIGLMASLTVNGYLFGKINAARPVEPVKEPAVKSEPSYIFGGPVIPRQPETNTNTGRDQRYAAPARRIVSPSEAIARDRREKDGLVPTQQQPKVPAAVQEKFLEDAGAVVASSAT
jgi:hypothetical protein